MESLPFWKQLFQLGGGYVLAVVAFALFFLERRQHKEVAKAKDKLYDRLFEAAEDQVSLITEVKGVLRENDRTLDNVVETLKIIGRR